MDPRTFPVDRLGREPGCVLPSDDSLSSAHRRRWQTVSTTTPRHGATNADPNARLFVRAEFLVLSAWRGVSHARFVGASDAWDHDSMRRADAASWSQVLTGPRKRSPTPRPRDFQAQLVERVPAVLLDERRRVITVSPAAVLDFGIRPEAWIGRDLDELLPKLPPAARAARTAEVSSRVERRLGALGDRGTKILECLEIPLESKDVWVLLFDCTETHRLRAECMHLGQLASAGRLISGIVHEINNPLSGIIGYSQLLLLHELDRETKSAIEKIRSEATRASQIVRNLLDFSRRRTQTDGAVEWSAVARKALELKAHDLRVHNVAVHLDLPKSLPPVRGDAHSLLQVLVNLIANAEQAMYECDRGGRIVIAGSTGKDGVSLTVHDTGPGISPEHRDRVFEAFFTTKGEGKGTGLGLGLCREILHRFGGTLQLRETSESGACFEIRLPVASERGGAERPATRRKAPRVSGKRILVVEDDPVCRAFVAEAFESAGNEVHAFDRSEPALKFLHTRWVDAIVSDLHRPGANGIEFHGEVKKIDDQLARRVLFLTGDTLNQDLARHLARSGNPVLPKPVDLVDLHRALSKLLAIPNRRQKTLFSGGER